MNFLLFNPSSPSAFLPNLWTIHPFLTRALAVLLAIILLLCVFQATKGVLEIIVAAKGDRRRSIISLGLAIGALGFLFWSATWFSNELTRARPVITSKTGKVLSPDYSIEWAYPDEASGTVKYFVSITDRDTGDTITPRLELLPNARLVQPGNMLIQIEAVSADSSSVRSEAVEVEWYRDSLERIQKTRELVVGVHADNSEGLFCFRTSETKEYEGAPIGYDGFDIDLIKKIKEDLETRLGLGKLKLKLIFVPWPDIIERPNQFDVDFALASISITPARQEKMLFSDHYWKSSIDVLQPRNLVDEADRNRGFALADFKNQIIGVHRDTTEVDFIKAVKAQLREKNLNVEYKEARNNTELFAMMESSQVTAIIYDSDRALTELRKHPNWHARAVDYEDLTRNGIEKEVEEYGIVFAKVNEKLRNEVNRALSVLVGKNRNDDSWTGQTFGRWKNELAQR